MPPLVFFLTLWAAHPKIRLVFYSMRTATRRCLITVAVPVLLSAGLLAGQARPGNVVVSGKVWVNGKAVDSGGAKQKLAALVEFTNLS